MKKVMPYFLVLVVVAIMSVVSISTCVPNEKQSDEKKDVFACSCLPIDSLELVGDGVVTRIKYVYDNGKNYIQFNLDGVPMELYFDGAITDGDIVSGEHYYIYKGDGKTVMSRIPKH